VPVHGLITCHRQRKQSNAKSPLTSGKCVNEGKNTAAASGSSGGCTASGVETPVR